MSQATTERLPCRFIEVEFSPTQQPCDRCQRPCEVAWQAERTALDLDADRVGLLLVRVGVYRCAICRHYFRAQPPFLRKDAVYTNRVIAAAVDAVYRDGMALCRVPDRLARDFHLRPSEASVRLWCRQFSPDRAFETEYTSWVRSSFSGVLCVDEVYQGRRLALLLAVDPRAPDGDRLVGFELVDGSVEQADVERFLERLRQQGIKPEQLISDGSNLYPDVVKKVWPKVVHQLCLFHETKALLSKVVPVIDAVKKAVPAVPTLPGRTGALPRRPDPSGPSDADRDARIALAKRLAKEGSSLRAVARQLGHSRNTIKSWVHGQVRPREERDATAMKVTALERGTALPPPPDGWKDWDQVRTARDQIRRNRFLLLARHDRLESEDRQRVQATLSLPCAEPLRIAHQFVQDWYAIWESEPGVRRSVEEARERYTILRGDAKAKTLPALAGIQHHMTDDKFNGLSPFLNCPTWEATNNGAERQGRLFRQLQAPHFRMRTKESIKRLVRAKACQKMALGSAPPSEVGRSKRGRRPKARPAS